MPGRDLHVDIYSPLPPETTEDIDGDCAICFETMNRSDSVVMEKCSHYFHRECIHNWHRTERRNNRPLSCPVCRTIGAASLLYDPIFKLSGGLLGPWGNVELLADQIVIRARYLFSPRTKQCIYLINIGGFFRNKNCAILVDRQGEMLLSFFVKDSDNFFKKLGKIINNYYEKNRSQYGLQRPYFLQV